MQLVIEKTCDFLGCEPAQLAQTLVAAVADGAETMQGCHNGVLQRLKREVAPFAVLMHDPARRVISQHHALSPACWCSEC